MTALIQPQSPALRTTKRARPTGHDVEHQAVQHAEQEAGDGQPTVAALSCAPEVLRRLERIDPRIVAGHLIHQGDDPDLHNLRAGDALLLCPDPMTGDDHEGEPAPAPEEPTKQAGGASSAGPPTGRPAHGRVSINVYVFVGAFTPDVARRATALRARYVLPLDQDGAEQWLTRWLTGRIRR